MIDPTAPLRTTQSTPPLANAGTGPIPPASATPQAVPAGPVAFPQTASSLSVSPGATAQTHVSLVDASVGTPEQDFAQTLTQRPLGETLRMLDFLKTYAATGARSVPADEMGLLQAIPQGLRNRLPELLRELEMEVVSAEIHTLDVEQPHQAGDLAERLHALTQGSTRVPTPEQLMDLRSQLPEPLKAVFDGLGLQQEGFRAKLPELSQRLQDVRLRQTSFRAQLAQHLAQNMAVLPLAGAGMAASPEIQTKAQQLEASRYIASLNITENKHTERVVGRYEGVTNMADHARAVGRGIADQISKMENYVSSLTGPSGMPLRTAEGGVDLSGFQADLDLRAGHNAVILRMFQHAGQNGAPSADIQQLKDVLQRAQSSTADLSDTDRQLLKKFGMEVHNQQLLNIVTQVPVSTYDIDGLIGLQEEVVNGLASGIKETAVAASGLTVLRFQTLLVQTDLVDQLEAEMEAGNKRLAGLKAAATDNTQAQRTNREAQDQAAGNVHLARERLELVDVLAPFLKGDKQGVDALFDYAIHRPELRNSLAVLGVEVKPAAAGAPPQILIDGRVSTLENAKRSVVGRFAQMERNLTAAVGILDQLKAEGQRLLERGVQIGVEIDQETQAQERRLGQHSEAISQLESLNLDELETLAQDPVFLQQLADSPEMLARYQKALARARQQIVRAPEVQQNTRRAIDDARDAAAENAKEREAMQQQLQQTQKALDQAQDVLKQSLEGRKDQTAAMKAAIATANRLASELILTPVPSPGQLQQIQQQWMQELEQLYAQAQQHLQQVQAQEQGAQSQETRFMKQLSEQSSYHLKQLEKLDQRQHERTVQSLQASFAALQTLLN